MGYDAAVKRAGGLPVLLPYRVGPALASQYVDLLDGIVFTGGNDLDSRSWGEEPNPNISPIDPQREAFERALIAEVERRRIPALGICLGSQLMNVTRGGSIIQFLPETPRENPLEHRKLNTEETRHPVHLVPETTLAGFLKKTDLLANSSHKQSVGKVGKGLRIIATSPDGIVEGVEDPTFPLWLGVQWHPERLAANEPDHQKIFELLIERVNQNRK